MSLSNLWRNIGKIHLNSTGQWWLKGRILMLGLYIILLGWWNRGHADKNLRWHTDFLKRSINIMTDNCDVKDFDKTVKWPK